MKLPTMLSLEDPQWSNLRHAYGQASDIPGLLAQLKQLPSSENNQEPWQSLWSSLTHQGDVFPATFAAVPHVIQAIASAPERADFSYFQFPAWVEICRQKSGVAIPEDLQPAYFHALSQLPGLVGKAADRPWEPLFLSCALAAIAASKGHPVVAEAVLELSPEVAPEFMEWMFTR